MTTVTMSKKGWIVIPKEIRNRLGLKPGDKVKQGDEMGFIKFGSRVDLLLPLDATIEVKIKQKVKGGVTILGRW